MVVTRILVTGASGFIGRAVVTAFAQRGDALRAAVRRPPQPPFPAAIEVVTHPDLAQPIDWRPLLDGVDQVIHLAGIAHIGRGVAPELYDRVNRLATAQLAAAAAAAGVKHFVFISSIRAQSGPAADHALTERDPAAPTDAYGRSKLAAEAAVRSAGVPFTILRPVLLYGPGVKGNFALLTRAAASPLPLPVKDFGNRRSLLGIDNFISALAFVLATPATIGQTYVVADPGMPPSLCGRDCSIAAGRGPAAAAVADAEALPRSPATHDGANRPLGPARRQPAGRCRQAHGRRLAATPRHADRPCGDGSATHAAWRIANA